MASYAKLAGMEMPPAETAAAVKEAGGVVPEKQPARGADGKFAASPDKEQPAETPDAKEPKWTEGDRQKAVTALSRAKVPESALKALSEEERVQWGLDLAKGQAENDRKVAEQSFKAKGSQTQVADSGTKPAEQPATPSNLRSLAEALALDGEGERLLVGEFDRIEKAHSAETEKLHAAVASTLTRLARESLVKDFPGLADDEAFKAIDDEIEFEQVKPKYAHLSDPYEVVKACIENLSKVHFADSMAARAKEAARKESARRDAGQLTGATKPGSTGKMGRKEYAVASMNLLATTDMTPDQVRRHLGG